VITWPVTVNNLLCYKYKHADQHKGVNGHDDVNLQMPDGHAEGVNDMLQLNNVCYSMQSNRH